MTGSIHIYRNGNEFSCIIRETEGSKEKECTASTPIEALNRCLVEMIDANPANDTYIEFEVEIV